MEEVKEKYALIGSEIGLKTGQKSRVVDDHLNKKMITFVIRSNFLWIDTSRIVRTAGIKTT
jgi:hypothetical protein